MINIAVATVSVPTKGLSLPLVSAGGSGLIITCAALGFLRSTARFKNPADEAETGDPLAIPPPRVRPNVPEARRRDVHIVNDALWQKFTAS